MLDVGDDCVLIEQCLVEMVLGFFGHVIHGASEVV